MDRKTRFNAVSSTFGLTKTTAAHFVNAHKTYLPLALYYITFYPPNLYFNAQDNSLLRKSEMRKTSLFEGFCSFLTTEPPATRKAADEDCALRRKPPLIHCAMKDERNCFG